MKIINFKHLKILFSFIIITTFPVQAMELDENYVCIGMRYIQQICVQERGKILNKHIIGDEEEKQASLVIGRMCGSQGLLNRNATKAEIAIYEEAMNYLAELQLVAFLFGKESQKSPLRSPSQLINSFQLDKRIPSNPDTQAHIVALKTIAEVAISRTNKETFKTYYSWEFLQAKPRGESQSDHIRRIWKNAPLPANLQPAKWEGKEKPLDPWSPSTEKSLPPTQLVFFQHGGGLIHILKALLGKAAGYNLEGDPRRLGIQVSPFTKGAALQNVAATYAGDRLITNFDYPAILVGSIESQYLDSANSYSEAGIRNEHLGKINILKLQPLAQSDLGSYVDRGKVPILDQFLEEICSENFLLPKSLLNLYKGDRRKLALHWKTASSSITYKLILQELLRDWGGVSS